MNIRKPETILWEQLLPVASGEAVIRCRRWVGGWGSGPGQSFFTQEASILSFHERDHLLLIEALFR
jgi:hypothetical protein